MKLLIRNGVLATFAVFALLAVSNSASAQGPDYGYYRVMFVEIQDLDAYSYGAIAAAIKENADLSIRQSCVPAKMIMFDIKDGNDDSLEHLFQHVKSITLASTDLTDLRIMAEYTEEDFLSRCAMFRTSAPE
jgi:hypothetical protein